MATCNAVIHLQDYQQRIEQRLPSDCSEEQLCQQLRLFRRRELIRIIWRDFSRQAPLLGDHRRYDRDGRVCYQCILSVLHRITCQELGTPCREGAKE